MTSERSEEARVPGLCPGCGADWRVGPRSRGRMGTLRRCRCATAQGGSHDVHGCQDCDAEVLVPACSDPSLQSGGQAFRYERPALGE